MSDLTPPHPEPPPLRVERLTYQPPMDSPRRPGILTAVGIISIVVASLSLITTCLTGFYGMIIRNIPVPVLSSTTMPTTSMGAPADGVSRPEMMKPLSRVMVVAAMNRLTPISEPRQEMLDQLLAEAGDRVFPFSESNFTPARLAGSISASGQLPGSDSMHPGNTYFVLANGRIELADDHAVFSPARGGEAGTVRVYRKDPSQSAAAAVPPITYKTWSAPAWVMRTFVIALLLNVLLAGLLMWAGIMILRDSPKARAMHLGYAWLKFAVIVLAVYGNWHYIDAFTSTLSAATPGVNPAAPAAIFAAGFPAIVACIYPIALLIVLNARSIKSYYHPAR